MYGPSIEESPEYINNQEEFGHWEIDTIAGKRDTGTEILTLDERLTRERLMLKIEPKTAEAVSVALGALWLQIPANLSFGNKR